VTRCDVFLIVSQHAEKGFIRCDDGTLDIPNRDSQNVGVDQAPNLSFALFDISVEARVLQ